MSTHFLTGQNDPRIRLTSVLNFAQDPWHLYAVGYLEAANALVEGLENGNIRDTKSDLMVYPIAFLYRHHIELRIKQLYLKVCQFLGIEAKLTTTHTLLDNWSHFKLNLTEAAKSFNLDQQTEEYLNQVDIKLNQFIELDKTSMTFRYPVDKHGNNLLSNRNYLHLGQLREFVSDLAQDLDNIDQEISRWFSIQSDWFNNLEFTDSDEDE